MQTRTEEICAEIVSRRRCGRVICQIENRQFDLSNKTLSPIATLDKFLQRVGLLPLNQGWDEISRKQAGKVLCAVQRRDLAYGGKIPKVGNVEGRTASFLDLFGENVRFFSNGMLTGESENTRQWSPATTATFDTGVVCLGALRIGILWVADED